MSVIRAFAMVFSFWLCFLKKRSSVLIITSRDNIVFPDIATSTGRVKLGVVGDGGVFDLDLLPRWVFDKDFVVA